MNSPTRKKLLSCTVRVAIALIGCAAQTPTTQALQLTSPSFQLGKFYDKQKYYRAAIIYYNEVIRQQPGSDLAKRAQRRINELLAIRPELIREEADRAEQKRKGVEAEQAAKARREVYVQAHPEYHKPQRVPSEGSDSSSTRIMQTRPKSSGTGFFITDDGYLITNEHVAGNGAQVRLVTGAGLVPAKVVKVDATNDLALLKAEGKFAALPVAASGSMKLGGTVATVGFPNIGLQGFAPKFARGEIASLKGIQDDVRFFQISVPIQPGNSGGALVDEHGNVVGVVAATLSAKAALATSGALPQNVNYAVKSSYLLAFLQSVLEVDAKRKEPNANDMKSDDVVEQAKEAAVLVLVY